MKFYAVRTSCNQHGTDLSNAQKYRYPDPKHNTKINDFDVKWAILMLTEQLLKNRSEVQCKAKKLHLVVLKYNILFADDILQPNWYWFIQCAKCRYPDPEHNTKINDFDIKCVILMLTD